MIEDILIATFCGLAGWGGMFMAAHIANQFHHQAGHWKRYAAMLEKTLQPDVFIAQDWLVVCPCEKCRGKVNA